MKLQPHLRRREMMEVTYFEDTIAAVSTAVSEAGIGIVRISGPEAVKIADRVLTFPGGKKLADAPTHTIHYGFLHDANGDALDEVLVSVMLSPRSYTAEDTVEINCHGGVYIVQRALEAVTDAGARLAEAGEFTRRAYMNGRIDLTRAEAVMEVIRARSDLSLKSSVSQLKGSVWKSVSTLRDEILTECARIEAALDDPEHYDLDGYADTLKGLNEDWKKRLNRLIATAKRGTLLSEGINTVIVGKPNAGKSSLLNRFAGEERAIVTQVEGTTRDVIRHSVQVGQLTLHLADTAGIRDARDEVEQIGVGMARDLIDEADLILYVVDSARELDENDEKIAALIKDRNVIVLLNKADLVTVTGEEAVRSLGQTGRIVPLSALTGEGMEELEKEILDMFHIGELSFNDEAVITNMRHKNLLGQALESLEKVTEGLGAGLPEDLVNIDLVGAAAFLGEITGESIRDDLADEIFDRFCMGK